MFYYELFPISEDRLRLCLYAISVYTTCTLFATGLVHVFWAQSSQCLLVSDPRVWYVGWSLSIASELLVFALPFGILPTLKTLPKRDKTGLICLFLLGAITVVVSTVRFVSTTMSTIDLSTYILSWTEITTQSL
ncbi:hypothetical protein EDB81DRAFT_322548 [Dactylonectria macrodidyma]|uniref:Rhodopsin domain-containing protein n=1 Tax=Dactylonectria macrodidyma TaxID=307937 RepID=A0A9P9FF11_9HYPO|nr:hypothetical protein EDB81DRAFT_322548 [Dactylonectria macrodidyma]